MDGYDAERVATLCGIVAVFVSLSAVYGSTVVSGLAGNFTWQGASLSSMGRPIEPTFLLFNGGLVIGGIVGAPFAWRLWRDAETHLQRAGAAIFGYSVLAMAGIGVAYLDGPLEPYHFPAALSFYFGGTVALWLYGSGLVIDGRRRWGAATVVVGLVHMGTWIAWSATTTGGLDAPWFAVPEAVGATLIGGWVVAQGRRFLIGRALPEPTTA